MSFCGSQTMVNDEKYLCIHCRVMYDRVIEQINSMFIAMGSGMKVYFAYDIYRGRKGVGIHYDR